MNGVEAANRALHAWKVRVPFATLLSRSVSSLVRRSDACPKSLVPCTKYCARQPSRENTASPRGGSSTPAAYYSRSRNAPSAKNYFPSPPVVPNLRVIDVTVSTESNGVSLYIRITGYMMIVLYMVVLLRLAHRRWYFDSMPVPLLCCRVSRLEALLPTMVALYLNYPCETWGESVPRPSKRHDFAYVPLQNKPPHAEEARYLDPCRRSGKDLLRRQKFSTLTILLARGVHGAVQPSRPQGCRASEPIAVC